MVFLTPLTVGLQSKVLFCSQWSHILAPTKCHYKSTLESVECREEDTQANMMCLRTHTRNMSDSQKPGTSCEWSKGSQQRGGGDARRSSAIPVLPERGQQKRGFVKTHRQEKQAHLESNFQNSTS